MEIPSEVPVMVLPQAILFPRAMLPLYIFELRYRRMLADALHSHRMFSVAMQRPGHLRETPARVAGLGLIRASVSNRDGTSHLILQGVSRVELAETIRYKPYRVHRIRLLEAPACDSVVTDALVAKVRELVGDRIGQGLVPSLPMPSTMPPKENAKIEALAVRALARFAEHLDNLTDAEQVADSVTHALLSNPMDRQTILETVEVTDRLKQLIHFLMAEIRRHRKN